MPALKTESSGPSAHTSESSPLHIVHFVLSLDYGGLERVVLHLVSQAARLGQRASVICLERRGALADQAESCGAQVHCLDKPPGLRFDITRKVGGVLADLRPDVVHTHQIGALFYTGPAARKLKIPLVIHTEHGKQIKSLKQKLLGWWAARYADRFCCVSSDILQALSGSIVPAGKMEVIHNGIDTDQLATQYDTVASRKTLSIPEDAIVIGTIGRLARVKRQDLMLSVFARVWQKYPQSFLLIIGDGPERAKLEALAVQLGVNERVRFLGFLPEPGRYLHLISAFLLTSESEGLPLALLEAWAVGVPVVAFRVGGLPELIDHGKTGFLADFSNVDQMADHIMYLLSHPEVAEQIKEQCRNVVRQKYDVRRMAQTYDQRYRELSAERKG